MSNVTSGYDKQEGHHYISDKNLIPKYTYHYFKEGNSNEKDKIRMSTIVV